MELNVRTCKKDEEISNLCSSDKFYWISIEVAAVFEFSLKVCKNVARFYPGPLIVHVGQRSRLKN